MEEGTLPFVMEKRALVIAAHPDDPEFGMGGTAALWTSQGWEMHYLIVTDGSKGTRDLSQNQDDLRSLRQAEQRAAAAVAGVKSVSFLGAVDGEVELSRTWLGKVVEVIRRLKPSVVFTHAPEPIEYRRPGGTPRAGHRDHRTTGQLTLDACYPAVRDPHNFPEQGLEVHKVPEVYLWGSRDADFRVDVTEVFDRKLEALRHHASQFPVHPSWGEQIRSRWAENGRYYEHFQRILVPA